MLLGLIQALKQLQLMLQLLITSTKMNFQQHYNLPLS
jgi:hypothetical protein